MSVTRDANRDANIHGVTCTKRTHTPAQGGYLHGPEDDRPYDVDGLTYCGRCHEALAGDPRPAPQDQKSDD